MRDEAAASRKAAAAASIEVQSIRRALQRAEQRAATAERRAAKLLDQLQASKAAATRARMARDEAQRLLKRKLALAKDAELLRGDPDALLAIIAEQRALLAWYRRLLAAR